jgi:hypothetical protein
MNHFLVAAVAAAAVSCQLASAELTKLDKDLAINGPYYRSLVQMKDVVADILPPPAYIIESHLTVLRAIDRLETAMMDGALDVTEASDIEAFIAYGRKLKDGSPGAFPGYYERIEVWKKDLSDSTPDEKLIKKLLTVKSAEPATRYFAVRDETLEPLLRAGKVAEAKALARSELKSLYQEHRGAIDAVVTRARRLTEKIEAEVAAKLSGADVAAAEIRIKSPLYTKVILMKDLVSDILPPPAYIIESYLTVLQQIDECEVALVDGAVSPDEQSILDGLQENGRQLESGQSDKGEMAGYAERIAAWTVDLSSETPAQAGIKDLMINGTCTPAKAFYKVRNETFLPAIKAGKVADAKRIARQELLPLYEQHRAQIDKLVVAANARYEQVQAEVDKLLEASK